MGFAENGISVKERRGCFVLVVRADCEARSRKSRMNQLLMLKHHSELTDLIHPGNHDSNKPNKYM